MKVMLIFLLFSSLLKAINLSFEDFLFYLNKYYYPEQMFYTYEEERILSQEFLNSVYGKVFRFDSFKFIGKKKLNSDNFQKPFTFCSRLHLLFLGCHIHIWSELPKTDTKFDIYGPFCGWPKEHFCYYEQNPKEPIEFTFEKKIYVLKYRKKIDLCLKERNFCYGITLILYLVGKSKSNEINFILLGLKETAPFYNQRILEIYGKIIE